MDDNFDKSAVSPGFPCLSCGKVYNRKGNMLRHKRYECGKAPQFTCSVCLKKFFRKDKLVLHQKMTHQKIFVPYN